MGRAMATDRISTSTRSRSPPADRQASSSCPSILPPAWMATTCSSSSPTSHSADRSEAYATIGPATTIFLHLKLLAIFRHLNTMVFFRSTRSSTIGELETLVVDTFTERRAIYLNTTDFFLAIETSQGHQLLNQPNHSILDILNWHFHQHCYAHPSRNSEAPHPDASDTGVVIRTQSIPRGHPLFSHTAVIMTDPPK